MVVFFVKKVCNRKNWVLSYNLLFFSHRKWHSNFKQHRYYFYFVCKARVMQKLSTIFIFDFYRHFLIEYDELHPNITFILLYDVSFLMKIAKYERGAPNRKNSSSQKNDSIFRSSQFEALKQFFSNSASRTEYENVVLKFDTFFLIFEKIFVLGGLKNESLRSKKHQIFFLKR